MKVNCLGTTVIFWYLSDKAIEGPSDVGGSCPKDTIMKSYDDEDYCCCENFINCCWNNCTMSTSNDTIPESCINGVSGKTKWVYDNASEYFYAMRLQCKF